MKIQAEARLPPSAMSWEAAVILTGRWELVPQPGLPAPVFFGQPRSAAWTTWTH